MQRQINLAELILFLELPVSILDFIKLEYKESLKELEVFKEKIKKQRRVLSKKYHPDLIKDDGNRMKQINNISDALLKLKVVPPKPRNIVHFYTTQNFGTSNSTTGTMNFSFTVKYR